MINSQSTQNQQRMYRIDKFKVPPSARDEFLARIRESRKLLSTLAGFIRHSVFEQSNGPGAFNFVTLAEWESAEALENAVKSVAANYQASGFNPQQTRARLGIEADVAVYVQTS
jgi:heme-degrading monooxygenase HmoA